MNFKMSISIMIICTLILFHFGITKSYSQGNEYIIKLKSGSEITTNNILIEGGIVYYIFSSYGEKKVGIARSAIAKIFERNKSGALIDLNIYNKSKKYARGTLAKKGNITKSLNEQSNQSPNP